MIKQLIANGKSSYDDFGIYIKKRTPSLPNKRKNRQSVPGMHGSYDFSSMYGEVIYEDRLIEYVFDITGWDIEDLDNERRKVLDWIMNINDTEIYDDYSPNYHWYGSFDNGSWKEDAEQGLLTVKFIVYPFSISNRVIEANFNIDSLTKIPIIIDNHSSHKVLPKVKTNNNIVIEKNNNKIELTPGEWEISNFFLDKGENIILITGNAEVCISYYEEVF